jgi:hypothetical protein
MYFRETRRGCIQTLPERGQSTREHLQVAARNQKLARDLLGLAASGVLQPPPYEWIVVIAFYSAIHYVNAYVWEIHKEEVKSHWKRSDWVGKESSLEACRGEYLRLENVSFSSRYDRRASISAAEADQLVNTDLTIVESVVRAALPAS